MVVLGFSPFILCKLLLPSDSTHKHMTNTAFFPVNTKVQNQELGMAGNPPKLGGGFSLSLTHTRPTPKQDLVATEQCDLTQGVRVKP